MRLIFICIILFFNYCFLFCAAFSSDAITIGKPFSDNGELVISKGRKFALGFFSPGKSAFRFVGIWYYNLPKQTVVWVANRDNPINDSSGVLFLNPNNGNLVLRQNSTNLPIWSSNVSVPVPSNTVMAQLTDLGNLVLIQNNDSKNVLWQSFDHLTDTLLPYAKLGFNKRTGQNWLLQSWKTEDDPGTGNISFRSNTSGKDQVFLYHKKVPLWRGGFFNGEIFVGLPSMKRELSYALNLTITDDDNSAGLTYHAVDPTAIFRVGVVSTGYMQTHKWDHDTNDWKLYGTHPASNCETYGTCGANSKCDSFNYAYNKCFCLPGFEPSNPNEWYMNDESAGCVRKKGPSLCGNNGEGFIKVDGVKIPDTSIANFQQGLRMEDCEQECLRNCTCNGYAASDVRNGGSGCLTWHGDLLDTTVLSEEGHDLYVRVDAVELGGEITEEQMKIDSPIEEQYHDENRAQPSLPCFSIKTIMVATNKFSNENRLGQGGFGSVYKGSLFNGQEIAVKRLSQGSRQGTQEFKNEIKVIGRLQHRNLVKLLGYCIHKKERMLIYEYLPNKSLDFFLFDRDRRSSLDWDTRFHIIIGIARGILYLHQDSRLKIIHRDLKASNVLLDLAMNPKISDFGMARIFGEDQIQANTKRIVGTYGYMSPEYAMEGQYSTKSDVFSFGILLIEIICGKRNTDHDKERSSVNLIGHVWEMWREEKSLDMVDPILGEAYPIDLARRCIHIGLLCVQENASYRPSMSEVIYMLGNEVSLPSPRRPAFLFNSNAELSESSTSKDPSVNEITGTTISAR
ncbi:G-type lectin S-receptor-like serine/threonine-protein kinase At1g11410 [Neltuma alba]|uniref:G-type lectin S-receptor-like serine/threonine-protein kinase At1g11410 n=1 Tax=Neltuma alba TaxID=207710 RepID=UPI0010A4A38A|nr:G-type lectin S-receptor-like serine/threonine-protein kinase At1g11410 [Prosopis alba]